MNTLWALWHIPDEDWDRDCGTFLTKEAAEWEAEFLNAGRERWEVRKVGEYRITAKGWKEKTNAVD